ncbi:hypothetical protein GCM10023260_02910 [Bartonella acomydis]|uniref:Uncharacterized protein n=1 Tax=Bartonella acomydis TaxID=686234 RepID=A0ABP9MHF4_9HYPH
MAPKSYSNDGTYFYRTERIQFVQVDRQKRDDHKGTNIAQKSGDENKVYACFETENFP